METNNMRKFIIFCAATFIITASGCATTSNSVSKIEGKTPETFTLPINYIDAYSNAKSYYLKCIASNGTSYPITVSNNGSPVTVSGSTPIVRISSNLDRAANLATMNVLEGGTIREHVVFSKIDDNNTKVAYYDNSAAYFGLLRSADFKQKAYDKKVNTIKSSSSGKNNQCIK